MGGMDKSNRISICGSPVIGWYRQNRRLPAQGRGDASSSLGGTRCHLVFQLENEVMPQLLARERGDTLFSREAR
ncbi:hypothetical protein GW17_00042969 [Ensete ventricosum]|nr:hypothetical protein GW17_00042969 [Ensete ventricosum]